MSRFLIASSRTLAVLSSKRTSLHLGAFSTTNRFFSELGEATRERLRRVFRDYAEANYTQTLPSRIVKDILAAGDIDHDGTLSVEEVQKLLRNIESKEEFTSEEIQAWMHEYYDAPEGAKEVPVAKMKERMLDILKHNHGDGK
eukprot:scaffold2290_cov170-Amphora_coffeaeformis.AAC.10